MKEHSRKRSLSKGVDLVYSAAQIPSVTSTGAPVGLCGDVLVEGVSEALKLQKIADDLADFQDISGRATPVARIQATELSARISDAKCEAGLGVGICDAGVSVGDGDCNIFLLDSLDSDVPGSRVHVLAEKGATAVGSVAAQGIPVKFSAKNPCDRVMGDHVNENVAVMVQDDCVMEEEVVTS